MTQQRTYQFGSSILTLEFADITDSDAEVIVSSDDHFLSMGGGVSAAIRTAAGNALALDAAKSGKRKLGDVVVTTAGALTARYVFHVVTIGPNNEHRDPREVVRRATLRCLELLEPLGGSSIAFPALGTGVARFSKEDSAAAMAQVIADFLSKTHESFRVSIFLYPRLSPQLDYVAFYEEFARRAPEVVRQETSTRAADAPEGRPAVSELLLLEQERQRLEEALIELGDGDPRRREAVMATLENNLQERIRLSREDQARPLSAVSVFTSYAREDDELRKRLGKHLAGLKRNGVVSEWHDRLVIPGSNWGQEIDSRLENADLILFLLSADFMSSDYIMGVEVTKALARHEHGETCIIPIVLRPVDWTDTPFSLLQALPADGVPVTSWQDPELALLDITKGVRRAASEIVAKRRERDT